MVGFKIVIGLKNGRCIQKELQEPGARLFLGKKIGDSVKGDDLEIPELTGYDFQITGGSDYCGFPMRADVPGFARKRILAVKGVGMKKLAKGIKQRKTVCGNTIHPKISQINLKVLKEGKTPLAAPADEKKGKKAEKPVKEEKKEKPAKEEKKEEKPAEKTPEPKKEEKKEEKKPKAPKEAPKKEKPAEKKPEPKKEAPKETPKQA